jgi:hypothetical protein
MISLGSLLRFGPWLLGLFLAAQVAGVLPLMTVHIQHALESQRAIFDDLATTGVVDHNHEQKGHHRHGAFDVNDQCCTLHHHLTGVLPFAGSADRSRFLTVSIVPPPQRSPAAADPGLPERPPKLLLSV